ncbi:VWA domain-containing protein [Panacagrimonas sp.]|uniref:VWA domain-containing protein n=1 Tax=Panacagrimonas sp. TaxID=2480088 RepID=UPI003B52B934
MKRRRREEEIFGLSFLDVICCGFGAIVLLLVLTKSAEPSIREQTTEELAAREAQLQQLAQETSGKRQALEDEVAAVRRELEAARSTLAALRTSSDSLDDKTSETRAEVTVAETIEQRLAAARQTLTEEMRRLQAQGVRTRADAPVGGIPVDSEYIVFVIDTSGSMQRFAWPQMLRKMDEILDIYPRVKGMQVMSDEGDYLFNTYRAGQWIPDTPARRKALLGALATWRTFSDSSPVEGIERAIRAFAEPGKKISIYVLGDEFTGSSIEDVVQRIRRINPKDARGVPRARIHGVGFPTQYAANGAVSVTGIRFASLMRILCAENGGAFVGL